MVADPIQIQTPQPPAPPEITLPSGDAPTPLPLTAQNRGTRASLGLSVLTGMKQPEIAAQIAQPRGEDEFRVAASTAVDDFNENIRVQAIKDLVQRGQKLPPELLTKPEPSNPSTVIEKSFANAFTADLFKREDPDGIMADVFKMLPQHAEELHKFTKESISKRQYALTKLEGVGDTLKNQSWVGWGIDQALEMFQPYNELRLRGNTEGASGFALRMLGSDLKEQADTINAEPYLDGFTTKLDKVLEGLKGNPDLQHKFLSYILNSESPTWDNFWTAAMIGGGLSSAASRTLGFTRRFAQVTQAAQDGEELSKYVGVGKELSDTEADYAGKGKFLPDTRTQAAEIQMGDEGPVHEVTGQMQGPPERPAGKGLPDTVSDVNPEDQAGAEGPIHDAPERMVPQLSQQQQGKAPTLPPEVARPLSTGNLQEAAIQQSVKEDEAKVLGKFNPTQQAKDDMASAFKRIADRMGRGAGNLGRDALIRIRERLETLGTDLGGLLERQLRPDLSSELTGNPLAKRAVLDLIRKENPELDSHVINMQDIVHEPITNTYYAKMILGDMDGGFFTGVDGEAKARSFTDHANIEVSKQEVEPSAPGQVGYKITTPGATVESENGGWYVAKYIPIDLNKPIMQQFIGSTEEAKAPWGPIKAFFDWVSTPENSMSTDQRAKRLIATEGPSKFYALMSDYTSTIPKLSRQEAFALKRIISAGQNIPNKELGKMGYFFKDPHEFADAYLRLEDHLPSDRTIQAYFEFRGAMEADYWYREVALHRNALQDGNQEWQFSSKGEQSDLKSPWVTGKREQVFPRSPDAIVAHIPSKYDPSGKVVKTANSFNHKDIQDDLNTGKAQLIKVWNTDLNELAGHFGVGETDRVQYVLSYSAKDRGLTWGKLGRTEGGHLDREYDHYISQAHVLQNPITKKFTYLRDNNLFGVMHHGQALIASKVLDQIRLFKVAGDEAGARAFWSKNIVAGMDFKKVWGAFDPSRDVKGKVVPPRLNLREPIQARSKDVSLMDSGRSVLADRYKDLGGLIDGTKTGNPARSQAVQFTGERDSFDFEGIRDVGTKYNPVFKTQQDPYIDGISMMNRGLGRIINSLFMDDYKFSATRDWLHGAHVPSRADPNKLVGAAEYLNRGKEDTDAALRLSPHYYFQHGRLAPGTPGNIASALEADRMKIKAFVGIPSKMDTYLHSLEQHISDSIYGKFGPKALKLEPLWNLSKLSDGPRFLRSVLYNTKMGFFSPRQFLIHFATFVNAALISPRYAGHGMSGAMFHGWTALNRDPAVLAHLDEKASKMGWKPGEWLEAHQTGMKTNFFHVESGQLALLDDPTKTSMVRNKWGQFLDLGMTPFKTGVQSLKTAAWYTAFKEFRDLNPTGALARKDVEKILLRANDLSHNMSRASTSSIQKGVMTFGAQFSSYNLRLAELLTGKRLSNPEKARLFFGYMGIFGVPTAGGIVGLSSVLRSQIDQGNIPGLSEYVPGYSFLSTAIVEGGAAALINEATGHVPNLGESYGAKDLEVIERTLNQDTTVWEFFGGAAYSTLSNTWANSSPFRMAMMNMLKGEAPYNIQPQDWIQMLSEISSVNYAWRAYVAAETGKFMSRNGTYLEATSPEWGILSGITGLTDQSVADIYRQTQTISERRKMEGQAFRKYSQVMQRYFQAMVDNNPTQADQYGKNATILLQLMPIQERARAIARIAGENQALIDRVQWSYTHSRNMPDADRERSQNMYNKMQEMKQRNQ